MDHKFAPSAVVKTTSSNRFARPIGADDEPPVRLVAEENGDDLMSTGMFNVFIRHTVATGRRMDVHAN